MLTFLALFCWAILYAYPPALRKTSVDSFALFPNPTNDRLAFQFTIKEVSKIEVKITDSKGSFVKQLLYQDVKKGLNELYFSTEPLSKGVYFVEILNGKKILSKEKFVKY